MYTIGRSSNADFVDKSDPFLSKINSQFKFEDGTIIANLG
jgi:hypothetical protein